MSSFSSISLRLVRRLSTTTTTRTTISISKAKSKLKSEHDPDKALKIYSSVSSNYSSPLSSRYAQEYSVKRLAKSHRFNDIESFLESRKNSEKIIKENMSLIIRLEGIKHALDWYKGTTRSVVSFNVLLSQCVNSKLFDVVHQLFDELPERDRFEPDEVSYGILIRSYGEMGKPELGIERVKEMEERGLEVSAVVFTPLLHALYEGGKGDEAEKVWNEMVKRGCAPDVGAYNVKIMNVQGGDPEGVKGLIEEMSNVGLKPDTISYNYLMSCYCRNGMMDEAIKVYEDLEMNGCNPNASTFRTLIFYLSKSERFETGFKVFKESVGANKIPDFDTLKYLVHGLAKSSKVKDAKEIIRTMKKEAAKEFIGPMKKKVRSNVVKVWAKLEDELGLAKVEEIDAKTSVA